MSGHREERWRRRALAFAVSIGLVGVAAGQTLFPARSPTGDEAFSFCAAVHYRVPGCERAASAVEAAGIAPRPEATTASPLFLRPLGIIRVQTYRDATSNPDCIESFTGGPVTAFDETITLGPASTTLTIQWVGQVTIDSGASAIDGVALECTVTQGATTTACPGSSSFPWLIRRDNAGNGATQFATYSGTLTGLTAGQTATVTIRFYTAGGTGDVCYQTLTLAY